MKLDPGMHIGMHLVFFGKSGVTDGSYMLVPANEDEGAGGDVHYFTVEQDLGRSPEGPKASFANKGKPRFIINPCFI
jgi:hypothetical protein